MFDRAPAAAGGSLPSFFDQLERRGPAPPFLCPVLLAVFAVFALFALFVLFVLFAFLVQEVEDAALFDGFLSLRGRERRRRTMVNLHKGPPTHLAPADLLEDALLIAYDARAQVGQVPFLRTEFLERRVICIHVHTLSALDVVHQGVPECFHGSQRARTVLWRAARLPTIHGLELCQRTRQGLNPGPGAVVLDHFQRRFEAHTLYTR
mmetsp:Transcript_7654/g.20860  ORF Transcript_7654/g.20860 Transcript_7654/m.20860 type:complete len:207 (+) Transcript_7654:1050-1670(+)